VAATPLPTASWFTTFFTPLDWEAKFSAAPFSSSVWTVPDNVTIPFSVATRISRVFKEESAKSFD
jgi:hypothetical protein